MMKGFVKKSVKKSVALLVAFLMAALTGFYVSDAAYAYDGAYDQSLDYSDYESMYLYTIDMTLSNPCNSKDMDKDSVYQLWFDFEFVGENGDGQTQTYRLDMSWKSGRNLNSEILKAYFIRPNDNSCQTSMKVWVPGLVTKVKVHLNMDGWERMTFYVDEISLNGFRVNTNRDYVSSVSADSNATINCRVPTSRIVVDEDLEDPETLPEKNRDQFGALVCESIVKKAKSLFYTGAKERFYHLK